VKPGRLLERVRAVRPVVHHLTNFVTANDVANVTLATGAVPVMAHAAEEVAEVVDQASCVVLNLGTPTPSRLQVMREAGRRANARGVPVVMDPVGVGLSRFRAEAVAGILQEVRTSAVRANLAEMAHLAGAEGLLRGVESAGAGAAPEDAARRVARRYRLVAAVTGPQDWVTDGARLVRVDNGHPLLQRITGGGCMATAVVACFMAVAEDLLEASVAALAYFGYAAELAAAQATGGGSFRALLLDQLAQMRPEDLEQGARVREVSSPATGGSGD